MDGKWGLGLTQNTNHCLEISTAKIEQICCNPEIEIKVAGQDLNVAGRSLLLLECDVLSDSEIGNIFKN